MRKWTQEEINILYNNATVEQLVLLLPNKTKNAILNKMYKMNIKRKNPNIIWSEEEIEILQEYGSNLDYDELLKLFPNKTKEQISGKIDGLKIKRETNKVWNDQEVQILLNNQDIAFDDILKLLPDKSIKQINKKCRMLNIRKMDKWTDRENKILIQNSNLPIKDLHKLLPNRTIRSIKHQTGKLNLDRKHLKVENVWTEEEINFLKNNLYNSSFQEIGDKINRTAYAVKVKASKLGLSIKHFITCTNEKCNSFHEKMIFDFIYKEFKITSIKPIGKQRKHKFHNKDFNENYFPDFFIETLNKPLYIEYYGLFKEDYGDDKFLKEYHEKTHRKNKCYKNNNDIYFIDLYPDDLLNNFEGVSKKLILFLCSLNKIHIIV